MLHDKIIAAIRTGCAVLGTFLVAWAVSKLGDFGYTIEADESWGPLLAGLLFGVLVALYNLAVAWLTEHVWDGFGWLLGVNKPPAYVDADLRPEESGGIAVEGNEVTPGLPTVQGGTSYQDFLDNNPDPHGA